MLTTIIKLLLSFVSKKTDKHSELLTGTVFKEVRLKGDLWLIVDSKKVIMTIGDTLYAHPDMWKDMVPSLRSRAIIQVHEALHARRQLERGIDDWILKYLFDKKFRWEEEKLAYAAEWEYMIKNGYKYSEGHHRMWAEILSSKTYGDMVSFEEAYQWVSTTMNNLMEKHSNV